MLKTPRSRETWLFWIIALLVLGAGLGLRDPWPADEPRFALVAKQMIESGDWLFPHRGTELYSDKPPMFMWLQAAAYTLFGNWRVAFLLPPLLAALGTLWCVVDLGKRLWTRRVGLYAGYALLLALQFTYQAKKAQIDPVLVFWITLANYGLLRHLLRGPDWKMWVLGWFAAGIGTITKGVGGLALLMLLPALFAMWRGWSQVRLPWRDWRVLLGPLMLLIAVSLWLVPMVTAALSQPDPSYRAYLDDILLRQTAGRYANSWDHHQPPWYHLGVMLTMWLPPLLALPWALPAWKRRLQRGDARYLLPLVWWVLLVVFFSIPSGKRDVYIMPALPMACLALAPLLPGIVRKLWPRRLGLAFGAFIAVVALAAGVALLNGQPKLQGRLIDERGLSLEEVRQLGWLLLAIGTWFSAALLWFRVRRAQFALVAGLSGLWVLFSVAGYPLLNRSNSGQEVMDRAGRIIGPDAELALVAWREQNLYAADRAVTTFEFGKDESPGGSWDRQWQRGLAWQRQAPQQRWLFVLGRSMPDCIDHAEAVRVGVSNRREWWLVPAAAATPCR
ncbi:MAG TPA: glycosyltransferase family 39 protein [Lysobacter sp.]|nr:glycosyltransferase family 39 protein [Lysobacter sp.]